MSDLGSMDFSMKPQVDISSIATVLQRKRQMEIEAKAQRRQQNLQEIQTAVQMGTQLTSTLINRSKEQQKEQFVKNQAEALAQMVPASVTKFNEPKKVSTMFPALDSVATPPSEARQNLMRTAALVNPEEASKAAFKMANPGLGDKPMQFQRMTLKGSDGKPRQVNVGMVGNQMVNPFTQEPVDMNDPAQVDALPEYGFVQREEYAGTDKDGNPVFRNPVEQTTYTKDANGNKTPFSGPILAKNENPTDRMAKEVSFIHETRANLKDAIDKFDPKFVGVVRGRVAPIKEWFGTMTDENQVEFRSFLNEIDTLKRHEMYGSALTASEQKFFNQISLDTKISPEAFLARIRAAERKLGNKEKALYASAKASGRAFRDEPRDIESNAGGVHDLGDGFSMDLGE